VRKIKKAQLWKENCALKAKNRLLREFVENVATGACSVTDEEISKCEATAVVDCYRCKQRHAQQLLDSLGGGE